MKTPANLGYKFATFPYAYGAQTAGYYVSVLATEDNTDVSVPDLSYSNTLNAGQIAYIEYPDSSDIAFIVRIHVFFVIL